jgi:hypothetical protein
VEGLVVAGVGLALGDTDGDVVGVGVTVADGEDDGERDGAGAELLPCAGPTRLGPCTG